MNATDKVVALAFNEWLRRYEKEPERFSREFETIAEFKAEEAEGIEPTYGESCTAYLNQIINELPEQER